MEALPISPAGRRYGYKKDKPDYRDHGAMRLMKQVAIPKDWDLEEFCGPKKDQADLGACTMFAGSGNSEYLFRKFKAQSLVLSPLFGYYLERQMDGTLDQGDTGSYGRTACRVMNKFGLCLESEDPYRPKNFEIPPNPEQLAEGLLHKAGAYHRLVTVDDMKHCIASDYPFLVGFTVYDSFERPGWTTMPIPKKHENILGGHEVLFIGYDDAKSAFKVRNSWGSHWAEGGNFWFPYEAAADPDIFQDAWIQHLSGPWK